MRKYLITMITAILLIVLIGSISFSELPELDLTAFSARELNQLMVDIDEEIRLHHEINNNVQEKILTTVKTVTESYYADRGISVSWAWHGWEYDYSRNMDFFTFSSHLDYKDQKNQNHQVKVDAELYFDGTAYNIYRLFLNGEQIVASEYALPDNLLIDTNNVIINTSTGLYLSLLNTNELSSLKNAVQKELKDNHDPRNSGKVNDALKKAVGNHFSEKGISVFWPWFDYNYTCDWNCYTETTRISYEENGSSFRDVPVYAEIFGVDGDYIVYFLKIGEDILLDNRTSATADNVLLFLRNRTYEEAITLLIEKKYEEAYSLFAQLGDFKESISLKDQCVNASSQAKYEEAISLKQAGKYVEAAELFNVLGDYSDSKAKADECYEAMMEIAYQEAIALIEKGLYSEAIEQFSRLGDYRDSVQKIVECQIAVAETNYQEALSLMKQGNYEQAIEVFIKIQDYKESMKKIDECNERIREGTYNLALTKMADGEYEGAISIFETISDYSDSEANILACQDNINQQKYNEAVTLFTVGKYEEAKEAFLALGEYKDSADRAGAINEIIVSINREITFPETDYYLFLGQKVKLEPSISLIEGATETEETNFVFTTDNQDLVRVAKDGTVTANQAGDAIVRCSVKDNPYIMSEVMVHVVKNVNRIVLNSNKADLSIPEQNGNSSIQLTCTIEPEDAYIQTGTWSSSNDAVATVDQDGKVQAVGVGRAVITFTSNDNLKGKKNATCNVNVVQAVTGLELPETSGVIYVGKTVQLKPVIKPQNAANKKLTWSSSDESVATVNASGQVKGITVGDVTITASSSDGPSISYKATVKIAPVTLKVSGTAKCIAKNHVGNSWTKEFFLNGDEFKGTGKITVENGDIVTVGCWITENDKIPDSDGFTEKIQITPEIMTEGLKIEQTVYVTENAGRYSGYSAQWSVVITIKP